MALSRLGPTKLTAPLAALLVVMAVSHGRLPAAPTDSRATPLRPNVLVVTVDTLRADRLSCYGYGRATTPNIDAILDHGVRFSQARVIEPLTNPALCSMMTSLHPQQHGVSRNGLRLKPGLASLPKTLRANGYTTAAVVGNWTLRDKLSGLGEHFEHYQEVLTRKRWFGFLRSEATAQDLTNLSLGWIEDHVAERPRHPYFLWVHYVEPHAPYKLQEGFAGTLGISTRRNVAPSDRYDTEIAFVDHSIGRLLREGLPLSGETLVVFAADHGESLGEHGYWGHGRNLYESGLRVPMGIYWPDRLSPRVVAESSLNIDLAPTVLALLGIAVPEEFEGQDWSDVLHGGQAPAERVTRHQAHKGAVISKHESDLARRNGLLSVALIRGTRKEILRIQNDRLEIFDLEADPGEKRNLVGAESAPSEFLNAWKGDVCDGLRLLDGESPTPLDDESVARLRALGYVD